MRKMLVAATALTLLAGSAYAQGNSPYNASGSQAGGPRGGMERAVEGRGMEQSGMTARKPMTAKRYFGKRKTTRKMRRQL